MEVVGGWACGYQRRMTKGVITGSANYPKKRVRGWKERIHQTHNYGGHGTADGQPCVRVGEIHPHSAIVQKGDYNAGWFSPRLAIKMHSETGSGWWSGRFLTALRKR